MSVFLTQGPGLPLINDVMTVPLAKLQSVCMIMILVIIRINTNMQLFHCSTVFCNGNYVVNIAGSTLTVPYVSQTALYF